METLLATLHVAGWAVYVGGAVTMEWVLRYAQRTMPPSQTAVVCKHAGSRYRWFALAALVVTGVTGVLSLLTIDDGELAGRFSNPELSLGDPYGRTLVLLGVAWLVLFAVLSSMAFWLHPAQARRSRPEMTKEEIQAERERVGRAIKRMEWALRTELIVSILAVGLGASLHAGGLF